MWREWTGSAGRKRGPHCSSSSLQNGLNALHLASKEGHVEVVAELIKHGANVDAATKVCTDAYQTDRQTHTHTEGEKTMRECPVSYTEREHSAAHRLSGRPDRGGEGACHPQCQRQRTVPGNTHTLGPASLLLSGVRCVCAGVGKSSVIRHNRYWVTLGRDAAVGGGVVANHRNFLRSEVSLSLHGSAARPGSKTSSCLQAPLRPTCGGQSLQVVSV